MIKSVYMENYSYSEFMVLYDCLEFSFKSTIPSNISIIDVNVNEEGIDF